VTRGWRCLLINKLFNNNLRDVVATSLPVNFNFVAYKCSQNDVATQIDGLCHRIGAKVPIANVGAVRDFKNFVGIEMKKLFEPINFDSDFTDETYHKHVNLPQHKIARMIKELKETEVGDRKFQPHNIQGHFKEEFYPTGPKTIRGIFARLAAMKAKIGPIVHLMEEHVFQHDDFAKKIPGILKASKILEKMDTHGSYYYTTDFESWESSMSSEIMEAVEIQIYDYLLGNLECKENFLEVYRKILELNKITTTYLQTTIKGRRMSGEMTTSLGNGLTNLMLLRYAAYLSCAKAKFLVEGDDGLISSDRPIRFDFFHLLGFVCKLQQLDDIKKSSFCGMIFTRPGHIIKDAISALSKFGWCSRKYNNCSHRLRMGLLRAKALSCIYETPHCPILAPFARRVLFLTRSYMPRFDTGLDNYFRMKLLNAIKDEKNIPPTDILPETRVIYDEMYGIDPNTQRHIEEKLSEINLFDDNNWLNFAASKVTIDLHHAYVNQNFVDNYNRKCTFISANGNVNKNNKIASILRSPADRVICKQ